MPIDLWPAYDFYLTDCAVLSCFFLSVVFFYVVFFCFAGIIKGVNKYIICVASLWKFSECLIVNPGFSNNKRFLTLHIPDMYSRSTVEYLNRLLHVLSSYRGGPWLTSAMFSTLRKFLSLANTHTYLSACIINRITSVYDSWWGQNYVLATTQHSPLAKSTQHSAPLPLPNIASYP